MHPADHEIEHNVEIISVSSDETEDPNEGEIENIIQPQVAEMAVGQGHQAERNVRRQQTLVAIGNRLYCGFLTREF